jgi:ABC-type branched-subunit amino acid transport system substrate-binding protein
VQAATEPWVIGQSLPISGVAYPIANRIQSGAKAWVDRVNANGGILGRPLELVTLDDSGDLRRLRQNVEKLVREHHALALVNCLGEQACNAAASATQALGVPLIGPLSGAQALRQASVHHVFSLRPDDALEAQVLVRQLQTLGVSRVVVLADQSEPARYEVLLQALQKAGLSLNKLSFATSAEGLASNFQAVAQVQAQALVLSLGPQSLDLLSNQAALSHQGLPSLVVTMSSSGLTQLTRLFRDRMLGYTSVVPNPGSSQLPVVRELERDADAFVGPEALSFEGMAAYLHLRLCTEALRRAGAGADAARLTDALEALGTPNLGGFRASFSREQHHGSQWVEIGVRTRDGRLLR